MTRISDAIWSLGRRTHLLADRIWDLSDWIERKFVDHKINREGQK